jgi:hypothetical protein
MYAIYVSIVSSQIDLITTLPQSLQESYINMSILAISKEKEINVLSFTMCLPSSPPPHLVPVKSLN